MIILVAGSIGAGIWFFTGIVGLTRRINDLPRFTVPGQITLPLEPGNYHLYAEYPDADTDPGPASSMSPIVVTDSRGEPVPVSASTDPPTPSGPTWVGPSAEFSVAEAGLYTVSAQLDSGATTSFDTIDVAIARNGIIDTSSVIGSVFGSIALGAVASLVGVILIIVTLVRRSRWRRQFQPRAGPPWTGGGPGYVPPGYVPPGYGPPGSHPLATGRRAIRPPATAATRLPGPGYPAPATARSGSGPLGLAMGCPAIPARQRRAAVGAADGFAVGPALAASTPGSEQHRALEPTWPGRCRRPGLGRARRSAVAPAPPWPAPAPAAAPRPAPTHRPPVVPVSADRPATRVDGTTTPPPRGRPASAGADSGGPVWPADHPVRHPPHPGARDSVGAVWRGRGRRLDPAGGRWPRGPVRSRRRCRSRGPVASSRAGPGRDAPRMGPAARLERRRLVGRP